MPMLYPRHFGGGGTTWPIAGMKKPNAIVLNTETQKWLFPTGYYCVVRRFSAKEEKRRIVASVVEPNVFDNLPLLGFENHLNVFHENRRGLSEPLARGLAMFLNSTAVDDLFRCVSGHTQVNATDLRLMRFPTREVICRIGDWAASHPRPTQEQIDACLGELIA